MSASLRRPIGIGCCIAGMGLLACSGTNKTGNGNGYPLYGAGGSGQPVGGSNPGAGGATTPGGGGSVTTPQGSGGTTNPGGGGATPGTGNQPGGGVSGGGMPPVGGSTGAGGASNGGAAGGTPAGGASGGGNGGSTAANLVSCNQSMETSAHPIMDACKDFTATPMYATKLVLDGPGQYGGQMDVNVGKGFENPDPMDSGTCPAFAAIFGEDMKITSQLLDVGTQPCNAPGPNMGTCLDMKLYSVYRPATWPEGPIPVLSWGNGTCAQPEGYGALLRYIASFGFFIVAANNREVGTGGPILKGLDFAAAANKDMSSPYFGHLDMSKVGVMGHSQGSGAAGTAAGDSRVKAVILYNGGTSNAKPYLAVSGDMDIGGGAASAFSSAMAGAAKGSYMYFHNPAGIGGIRGHLVLMMTPQRLADQSVQFWQMTLNGDMAARDKFMAQKTSADYDFGAKGF